MLGCLSYFYKGDQTKTAHILPNQRLCVTLLTLATADAFVAIGQSLSWLSDIVFNLLT